MSEKFIVYLRLIMVFVLWGSLYVVSSVLVTNLPLFLVAFSRFLAAFLFLFLLARFTNCRLPLKDASYRKSILLIGGLGYGIFVGLQLIGTKLIGSSTASLINSVNPLAMSFMGFLILKERVTIGKIIGILIAVFGVFITAGQLSGNLTGLFCSIAAVGGWSFISVLTRKYSRSYSSLMITTGAVGVAAVCNFFFTLLELGITRPEVVISAGTLIGLLYMGVGCTGIAYILWNQSLRDLPASTCSAFYPLQPIFSAIFGVIFLQEQISVRFIVGTTVIAVGILIGLFTDKR